MSIKNQWEMKNTQLSSNKILVQLTSQMKIRWNHINIQEDLNGKLFEGIIIAPKTG